MVEVRPSALPADERLVLAELAGTASRYGTGTMRHTARSDALAAVHEVTRDPALLGIAAGHAAVDPLGIQRPIVDLLQAAGADMATAALAEDELRTRLAGQGGGPRD